MEKLDRRVKYTQAILRDALVTLLRDTPIGDISVTKLCETAGVHRSTFYAHYTDQMDLLFQMRAEVMYTVRRYIEEKSQEDDFPVSVGNIAAILEYGKKNRDLITVLLEVSGEAALERDLLEFGRLFGFSIPGGEGKTSEYAAQFMVAGCLSLLRRWLHEGMEETPEAMAELIMRLVRQGYGGFAGAGGKTSK